MTHYEDLTPCTYFPVPIASADKFVAVGWLETGMPFETGHVEEDFFTKLCELLINPWHPPWLEMGRQECLFCQFSGGTDSKYKGMTIQAHSSAELFVPGEGVTYVSPESIAHYIDSHSYLPPAEFQEAVLKCPQMRSKAYLQKLLDNGVRELLAAEKSKTTS